MRLFADDLGASLFESGARLHVESADGWRTLTIEQCRETPDFGIVAFEEIEGRDAAERLRNRAVYVEDDDLPELDEDEFYQFQLQGADVELMEHDDDRSPRRIGSVGGFFETHGANDVMVVWLDDDEDDELFVPMTAGAIQALDPDHPRVRLAPADRWAPEDSELHED